MDVQPQPEVFSLAYLALHPEVAGIVVSAILAIGTWFLNAWRARKNIALNAALERDLQRKQLGIEIIFKYMGEESFVKHVQRVYRKINSDHNYDWAALAKKRYNNVQYATGEEDLSDSLCTVLNHLESLAIAALNDAADNDILKWSQRLIVTKISTEVKPFIEETRRLLNANHSWCNFLALADRWKDEDKATVTARPKT